MSYSKKVHCSSCGYLYPRSDTVTYSSSKAVLRLCMKDYAPIRKAEEARIAAGQEKMKEQQEEARQAIANRGKER